MEHIERECKRLDQLAAPEFATLAQAIDGHVWTTADDVINAAREKGVELDDEINHRWPPSAGGVGHAYARMRRKVLHAIPFVLVDTHGRHAVAARYEY